MANRQFNRQTHISALSKKVIKKIIIDLNLDLDNTYQLFQNYHVFSRKGYISRVKDIQMYIPSEGWQVGVNNTEKMYIKINGTLETKGNKYLMIYQNGGEEMRLDFGFPRVCDQYFPNDRMLFYERMKNISFDEWNPLSIRVENGTSYEYNGAMQLIIYVEEEQIEMNVLEENDTKKYELGEAMPNVGEMKYLKDMELNEIFYVDKDIFYDEKVLEKGSVFGNNYMVTINGSVG